MRTPPAVGMESATDFGGRGRPAELVIDLDALRHNLGRAREAAPGARVMAAVKANGYGHGLERVGRALGAADALGVASINEAISLREAGVHGRITLLEGFFGADELETIARLRLETVVHHTGQIVALENNPLSTPVPVWLKVDTGMHRLGLRPESVAESWQRLRGCPSVSRIVGFMTHLANADERTDHLTTLRQVQVFDQAVEGLPGERAIANSAGVLGWPQTHADWVRPGIMLYGASPFVDGRGGEERLKPVMTFRSRVIAVNLLRPGERVGYGGAWTCPEEMPVGVIAAGYGDGYPRHAPNGTPVLIGGKRVPLIGRVSMDMITVDLRNAPDAAFDDPVTLWGRGLPVEVVAAAAGTIPYELLCGVTPRVEVREVGAAD